MHYQISHTTIYTYDRPVLLSPHFIRLRPRCDVGQTLHQFSLELDPLPKGVSSNVDLDGNSITKAWFDAEPTLQFKIKATSDLETLCDNPFVYLLEPWAAHLPIDYPASWQARLQPYLLGQIAGTIDPTAIELAQEIGQVTHSTTAFLTELNDRIYQNCGYQLRESGAPLPPGITWRSKQGSCRDYAVLFMEVCRAAGIATRFVSGYQEGDADSRDRHLHAWAEAYLPGAGWRGYDPTQGLVVADRHIPLVASSSATGTTPVSGALKTIGATSEMNYELLIRAIS